MNQIAYDFLIHKMIILTAQLRIITFDKQLTPYIFSTLVFVFIRLNDPSWCNLLRCLFLSGFRHRLSAFLSGDECKDA